MPQQFVLLLLIACVHAERQYLKPDRELSWKNGNPNQGVYRGQPEQIHLSYGGKSFLQ